MESPSPKSLLPAIAYRLCPHCRVGKVYSGVLSMHRRCPHCDYDFFPEPGFYLGAMMVPYFFSAMTTVPFAIALKISGFEITEMLTYIAIFYAIVVTCLLRYAKIVWLHVEYRISDRLKQKDAWEIAASRRKT